jgi:hypothetical protein
MQDYVFFSLIQRLKRKTKPVDRGGKERGNLDIFACKRLRMKRLENPIRRNTDGETD